MTACLPVQSLSIIALEAKRKSRTGATVSRRGSLEDVNEAFRAMEAGAVTRTVLTFD
jgi:Zn-dependent alcohol dehydrogenase